MVMLVWGLATPPGRWMIVTANQETLGSSYTISVGPRPRKPGLHYHR